MAEISGGLYSRPAITTRTSPFEARVILYGTLFMVRCTSGSSNLRPMSRLMEKIVFSGLVTACRLATWPTRRSPLLVTATTEGVSRKPSLFARTVGSPPSITATTELVVPRSIPITFAIASRFLPFLLFRHGHCCQQPVTHTRLSNRASSLMIVLTQVLIFHG